MKLSRFKHAFNKKIYCTMSHMANATERFLKKGIRDIRTTSIPVILLIAPYSLNLLQSFVSEIKYYRFQISLSFVPIEVR